MKVQLQNKPINFRGIPVSKLETIAHKYASEMPSEEVLQRIIKSNHAFAEATDGNAGINPALKYLSKILSDFEDINEQFFKNFAQQLDSFQENPKFNNFFKTLTDGILEDKPSQAKSTGKILITETGNGLREIKTTLTDGEVITKTVKRKRVPIITQGTDEIDTEEFVKTSKKRKTQTKPTSNEPEKELKNPNEQGVKKSEEERVTRGKLYPLVRDAENKTWDQCKKEQKNAERELKQLAKQVEGLEKRKEFAVENITTTKEDVKSLKHELELVTKTLTQEKKKMTKITQGEYFQNRLLISGKKRQIREFAKRIKVLEGNDYSKLIEEHSKTKPQQEKFDDIRNYNNAYKKWLNQLNKLKQQEKESRFLQHYHKQQSVLRNEIKALESKSPDLELLNKKIERAKKFTNAENEASAILNSKSSDSFYEQQVKALQKEINILNFENRKKAFIELKREYTTTKIKIFQNKEALERNQASNPANFIDNIDEQKTTQILQYQDEINELQSKKNVLQNLNVEPKIKDKVKFLEKSGVKIPFDIIDFIDEKEMDSFIHALNDLHSLKIQRSIIIKNEALSKSLKLQESANVLNGHIKEKLKQLEQNEFGVSIESLKSMDKDRMSLFIKTLKEINALKSTQNDITLNKEWLSPAELEQKYIEVSDELKDKLSKPEYNISDTLFEFLKGSKEQRNGFFIQKLNELDLLENKLQKFNISQNEKAKLKTQIEELQTFVEQVKSLLPENFAKDFNTNKTKQFIKIQNNLNSLETELNKLGYKEAKEQIITAETKHQKLTIQLQEKTLIAQKNKENTVLNPQPFDINYNQQIDSLQKEIDELQEKFKINQAILAVKKGNPIPVEIDTSSESYKIFSEAKVELDGLIQKRNNLHFENEQKSFEQLEIDYQKLKDQITQKQQILEENSLYNPANIINSLDNEKVSVQKLNAKNGFALFLKSSKRQQAEIFTKTLNELSTLENQQQKLMKNPELKSSEKLQDKNKEFNAQIEARQTFIEQIKSLLHDDFAQNFDSNKTILFAKTQNELGTLEAELKNLNYEKVKEQLNYTERRYQELTSQINEKAPIVKQNKPVKTSVADKIDVEKINLYNELFNKNNQLLVIKAQLEAQMKKPFITTELSMRYKNVLLQLQENEAQLEQNKTNFTNPEEIRQRIAAKEKELDKLKTKQLDLQKQDNEINRFATYLEQKKEMGFPIRFEQLQNKIKVTLGNIFNRNKLSSDIEKMEKLKEKTKKIQTPFYEKSELISNLSIHQNDTSQRLKSAQKRLVDANIESSSIDKKYIYLKRRLDALNKRNQNKIKSKETVEETVQETTDNFFLSKKKGD